MNATTKTATKNTARASRPVAVPPSIATAKDARRDLPGIKTANHFPSPAVAAVLAFVAPALACKTVPVEMNAAQLHALEGIARRFRCTVPELVLTLALSWLEEDTEAHEVRGDTLTENLTRFADNGERPERLCVYADGSALTSPRQGERAAALLRAFGLPANYVRCAQGEPVDFDEVDDEIKRLSAALKAEEKAAR